MTTVEAPALPADDSPRRPGRPRVGAPGNGASKQDSIYFGPGQIERMKLLADRLHDSRNRQVVRAVRNLLARHGRKRRPPIDVPPGGRGTLRQWIPEPGQVDQLDALVTRWGLRNRSEALRVAVELLLLEEGLPPAPPAPEEN